ncbi:hypothetical protein EUZ85_03640 [Hahella sp. KA22]|uniref:hypothetical protein n=1 Tax=Hahella sp. KA22 TaxID=1628392 RepID=UPI000FDE43AB|nr:hypothetical protein [Hahella sp. KA22]AZZ89849.1 hypothetical protein ENC22_01095 [Hahella sp. KA22]QAY53218.1 hypothetical protein EUZ85_03640 [Hahella sp. KA22]
MCIFDVTIDTNVLMHGSNPNENRFHDTVEFLQLLLECETHICVDMGFNFEEGVNNSIIGHEYLTKLVHGQFGYAVITQMAQTGRIDMVETDIGMAKNRSLINMISNKHDRVFVRVAANSRAHVLVSHDLRDFPPRTRKELKKLFELFVSEASEAKNLLADE